MTQRFLLTVDVKYAKNLMHNIKHKVALKFRFQIKFKRDDPVSECKRKPTVPLAIGLSLILNEEKLI